MKEQNLLAIAQERGGLTNEKNTVNRKMRREALENFNTFYELLKIIKHFFPSLIPMLKHVNDPRNQSYITYESQVILLVRILAVVFHIGSMRKITESFNNSTSIKNIATILNIKELQELPYWETINDYLKIFDETQLEDIIQNLIIHLIRMRSFEGSRIRNKYWHILVDGTEIFNSNERHCKQCLTREHKDKDGNVKWTEYYHSALEAKLVINRP